MSSNQPIVRLRGPDTDWLHLGHDTAARGVVAEGMVLTANEQGPDTCSFTLKRSPNFTWPDLRTFSQMEVEIAGVVVWGGRVRETPGQRSSGSLSVAVQGEGWQYHLDDDRMTPFYVHRDLSAWRDIRTYPGVSLGGRHKADGDVIVNGGGISINWAGGSEVSRQNHCGVYLDTGVTGTDQAGQAKRATTVIRTLNDHATYQVYLRAANSMTWSGGSDLTDLAYAGTTMTTIGRGPTTTTQSFTTTRRFLVWFFYWNSASNATVGNNDQGGHGGTFDKIILYGDTAWEASNESDLAASEVFANVLGSGYLPLLDTDTSLIETTTFDIPELHSLGGVRSPRQVLEAANAYHDYLWGVTPRRRLYFKARPSAPKFETGAWSAADFSDSGPGGDRLYNQVAVTYTDETGQPATTTRTTTAPLLDRQGFTRTGELNVRAAITEAAAEQIGDVWLSERATAQMKGSLTLSGRHSVRMADTSVGVHPAHLLTQTGERIRLTDAIDENGNVGRSARITSASYNVDQGTIGLQLDNDRGRFEALLERLAAVQSGVR